MELRERSSEMSRPSQGGELEQQVSHIEFSLPPTDGGKDAWLMLAGGFVVEALVWGISFSYGIFQQHYTSLELFTAQQSRIPFVGTIALGIMYMCSPIAMPVCRSFPHQRRRIMIAGAGLLSLSYVAASFAKNVTHLILSQGVLFGIGASAAYYPVFLFIDEWFVLRKGFAYGLCWGSSGLCGLVFPYVLSWLLDHYGFRTTLRVWAFVNVALLLPAMYFLKPRLPSSMNVHYRRPRLSFITSPLFLTYLIGSIVLSLGYFLPGIYLPSYARDLGFSNIVATTTVALVNIGAFLGYVCGGVLTDRLSTKAVVAFSTLTTTLSLALIFGFAKSSGLLVVFGLLYGFCAATFVAAWPGIVREVIAQDATHTADVPTVYAFFIAGRGIGSIISGPLSTALVHLPRLTKDFSFGYGSAYGPLIVFAAVTTLCGGLGPLYETVVQL